ncbi:hypothetical protein SADUNF_Sadunf06G0040000 [Salix dunnii]|uniref:Uncharacterized protein n=1 Tax=Salix dunnii TaxID=1413687 RepID=A0A835K105_9ROSI|nr:hypothetical protein SADUNF_Sadunf06G0040000 [Salix dunnii]
MVVVMGVQPRILLVTFPAQGHINPALQFAKRLVAIGALVTFSTSTGAERRMSKTGTYPEGLSFAAFDDGSEHGFSPSDDMDHYFTELRRAGSKSLAELIVASSENGRPFTCVVYSNLIPWVAKVARELNLPSTLLWNQSPALLDIFYYYFNGYGDTIRENINDPTFSLKLPGLPPLGSHDLPSFLNPRNTHAFAIPVNREHIEVLDEETNPRVLVNTFDALECEALNSIGKFKLVGVGPLIPSAFLDGKDPTDTSFGVTSSGKEGIVEGEEIHKCLEVVMGGGERGKEMRENAKKWKHLARQSSREGGSSSNNLKAFVDEMAGVVKHLEI